MLRLSFRVPGKACLLLLLASLAANSALAQLETATVSGQVVDPSGLSITGAQVKLVDIDRDTTIGTRTNPSGLYTFPSVRPGRYRMEVTVAGFKVVNVTGLTVNVQDHLEQNFELSVGSVAESVTVEGGAPLVNTESATVSTVVDRNFAENLPLNGRSFQTLIGLTPGVVLSTGNSYDQGQFNVNGQRGYSNYWTVDGVSANIGISAFAAGGASGALNASSAQGGTNSLVSVDAMQEFRIQTSTFAPEFGRTPGAQVSIVTRSGTNQFHGVLFDYFRNDVLDANDWFSGYSNSPPIKKPEERQNDFGGTLGGPILKNRTFFFFSYEGLRLRQPQVDQLTVPSLSARASAIGTVQPFFNAFPLPNGSDLGDGTAIFTDSHSNRSTLDAVSLRIDHKMNDKLNIFARYNYSPSEVLAFQASSAGASHTTTHTGTIGATWAISNTVFNDFRFNYSRNEALNSAQFHAVGGATSPPFATLLPIPFSLQNSSVGFSIATIASSLSVGPNADNVQRQLNVVDSVSLHHGAHNLKFGVDFRRLTPSIGSSAYRQGNNFADITSAEQGALCCFVATTTSDAYLLFQNLSVYAQDTWQVRSRLTVTYGLRWDIDFAPSSTKGPSIAAVTSCCNLATVALAPAGTAVFTTRYANLAPRFGAAYQVSQRANRETVLRGGFGLFYDLADVETASAVQPTFYPFGSSIFGGGTFPIPSSQAVPPPVSPNNLASGALVAFDPHLKLPYTLEWNAALEQAIGTGRSVSLTYVGAAGRRLTQPEFGLANSSILFADLVLNAGSSDYDSLQAQFQQRLSRNLQILASYTWAHSIDTASASSIGATSNYYSPQFGASSNRGPSDFDIRDAFTAGVTYDVPSPKLNALTTAILGGWSLQSIIQARSAAPVDADDSAVTNAILSGQAISDIRPDVVLGQALYLYGPQFPGGKAFNPAAFSPPPVDPTTGVPLRQGTLGRNDLRGFGATQWDFAVHRVFGVRELLKLEFRAEIFNILNHPNFGAPLGDISSPLFGLSTQTLANALSGTGSSLSPLYQIGGPRSMQFALKFMF